jgi:signal transduction histidine kinase/ActR/RegA family two-component response regulator
MAVDALGAARVLVWRYVASSRRVSPIAGAVAGEASYSISRLAWRWSDKSVEDIHPFEKSLQLRRSVIAMAGELQREAPAFARELIGSSVWCEPVVVGQPVGILMVEPAPSGAAAEAARRIATSVGALLTWQAAERGRTQAELLLALIEAAGAHTGSPGELLAMVCEKLASQTAMTRASVFLATDGQLVPRMSSYADGHHDRDSWALFRDAVEPPPIVEAAFSSQRPVTAVNSDDPRLAGWWSENFGMQAAVAAPLGRPLNPIGALLVDSAVPRTFRHDDVRLIAAAGTMLGEIVERVQEAEEREARLAASGSLLELLKLGLDSPDTDHMASRLATIARQAMHTETAVVCLPGGDGGLHEAARAATPAAGGDDRPPAPAALSDPGQLAVPIAVTDARTERGETARLLHELNLTSGILIPLAGEGAGRGVLVCGDSSARKRSQRSLDLAAQLGLEGGLVLEATRLREVDAARRLELQAQAAEATRSAEVKAAFLANMSHEIRTPMNGVLGMNELLLTTSLSEEQRGYAEQVARSGEHMMTIIDEILDISKIEAGHLELDLTEFDFHQTVREACAVAGLLAEAKGLAFRVQVADDVPQFGYADRRRLRQVLLNLVSNAVKFTEEGAVTVNVSSRTSGRRVVRIEVADSGIGIDPAALERLFEPFTQADPSTTRGYGGTGLGLAIARELVELMGGSIGAAPVPAGQGSTFWFELELQSPVKVPDAPPAERTNGGPAALWPSSPHVLVAEDNPVNQIVAVAALKRCGCSVDVVSNGLQALEALSAGHYDAVLMDCQMPEMDGYAATRELRRREDNGHRTPVIAMTAHAMDGDRDKCLQAGMDDYVSKPVRREQLVGALQAWIPAPTAVAVADGGDPTHREGAR